MADTSSDIEPALVDSCIEELLSVRGERPGTDVSLPEEHVHALIQSCKRILSNQPALLELHCPINVVGDIHGQYSDLLRLFEMGGFPPDANYIFLGDYVDRATQGVEVMCLMMCYKIKFPETFFMLRGNHECASLTRIYGFYDECRKRYSIKLWKAFTDLFNVMPLAALIDSKIFCVHGGISPEIEDLGDILRIERPQQVPEEGILCDLLWADPDPYTSGWSENPRGVSYTFGDDIIEQFCEAHDIDLIVRAHQVVEDGYEFQCDRQLVTVFSAPNYCGDFDNAGAMMVVKEGLMCSFNVLRPNHHKAPGKPDEHSAL